jgi:hypothetical protein
VFSCLDVIDLTNGYQNKADKAILFPDDQPVD